MAVKGKALRYVAGGWRGSEKDAARLRWAFATQNGNGRVLLEEKRQMESGSKARM